MANDAIPDLMQATKTLETALADFQASLKASGVLQATGGPVFKALRQWRTEQAKARQLPPYVIASDAVLRAIEEARPRDLESLQALRGIGPSKAALYGNDILQIVAQAA